MDNNQSGCAGTNCPMQAPYDAGHCKAGAGCPYCGRASEREETERENARLRARIGALKWALRVLMGDVLSDDD